MFRTALSGRSSLTRLVRALALFELEAASVVFGVVGLALGSSLTEVLARNEFPDESRQQLMLVLGSVGLTVLVAGFIAFARFGSFRLLRWAKAGAVLIPLGLAPYLLETEFWFRHQLEYLVVLGASALACEVSLFGFFSEVLARIRRRKRTANWFGWFRKSEKLPFAVVCVASLAYVILTSYLTILDHYRFGTGAYDLGIFDNLMWNAMHGEPFRSTVMYGDGPGNSLASHAEFAMVLFVPIYALHPSAEMLLVIQATALGGAAILLYLFAATHLTRWLSVLISISYLLYAPLHGAQYYDFHWLPISIPFQFLLFYGIAVQRKRIIIPATVVLFLMREDMAPGTMIVGILLVLTGARPKLGIWLALSAAAWFALVKGVIMPHCGTWFFADLYRDLMVPGEHGYASVMKTLASNPLFVARHLITAPKFEYMLHILAPLAFLPLRRATLAVLLIPGMFFTLVTNWPATISIKYHYSSHFTPYVFAAATLYLASLKNHWGTAFVATSVRQARVWAGAGAVLFATVCHSTVFGLVIKPSSFVGGIQPVRYEMTPEEALRLKQLESLIAMIPRDASVTTTDFETPHLSNRSDIYAIGQSQAAGEYLLWGKSSFHLGRTRTNIQVVMEQHPYGFVARSGPFTLWKRDHESPSTSTEKAALYRELGVRRSSPSPNRR